MTSEKPRVFLTHSWKDIEFARKLSHSLAECDIDIWLDDKTLQAGQRLPEEINRGLAWCDVYIPILSNAALDSSYCWEEIGAAITLSLSKRRDRKQRPKIVSVLIEDCTDKLLNDYASLAQRLYIKFYDRPYEESLSELLQKAFQGISAKPTRSPTEAADRQVSSKIRFAGFSVAVILSLCLACLGVLYLYSKFVPSSTPTLVGLATATTPPIAIRSTIPPPELTPVTSPNLPTRNSTATSTPASSLTRAPTPTPSKIPMPSSTLPPTRSPGPQPTPEMAAIPAGNFLMGSTDENIALAMNICPSSQPCELYWFQCEKPQHQVFLDAFSIDKFEATNAEYKKCVDAGLCPPPDRSNSPTRSSYFGNPEYNGYPVVYVSWEGANAFCSSNGKRLPTEAEWEKAARGTDARIWPWGSIWDPTKANFLDPNAPSTSSNDTKPVGSYPNGSSPYGVMDMAGNVWEWVSDWYEGPPNCNYYDKGPKTNPAGPASGTFHVLRGGAFDRYPGALRTTWRQYPYLGIASGVRCVKR